jgi:ABC-type multidrug transport system fused ATPase/permease subunit
LFFDKNDFSSINESISINEVNNTEKNDKSFALFGEKGSLNISLIKFKFQESDNVNLKNIEFKLETGKIICLIGPSGAGKSTLVDIISGLLEAEDVIADVNGRNVNLFSDFWRSQIAYVPQETFIKSGSVLDNILMYPPDFDAPINWPKIYDAIKLSNCETFIADLEDGINTDIGDKGVKLSGGQKQRLAIARSIYSDKSIMIFDESTSALDAESEYNVMKGISKLTKSKIVIMIAHRIETVRHADKIAIMDQKTIKRVGTFNDLINDKVYGKYFHMT